MKLSPLHDRVILRPLKNSLTSSAGIVFPESVKDAPGRAEVVAVGPGRVTANGELIPVSVKAGDHVLHGPYSGKTVKVDGEELLAMRDEDLLAVLES